MNKDFEKNRVLGDRQVDHKNNHGINDCINKLIHFTTAEMQFFAHLNYVHRVIQFVHLLVMPDSPGYVKGIINVAGKLVFVIDLAERLGLRNDSRYSINTPVMICQMETNSIGIIVDDVYGVDMINQKNIKLDLVFYRGDTPALAVIDKGGELSVLLDLNKLLDIEQQYHSLSMSTDTESLMRQLEYDVPNN